VILLDGSQFKVMEPRVRPGGLMIVDRTGLTEEESREDIKVLAVPGVETAVSTFGEATATNLILLGIYIAITEAVPAELIEEELKRRYGAKESVLARNMTAFTRGLELGRSMRS
jgi:2-oxoglutarate ferredoxin oxidoreductase subunit gamma